MGNPKIEDNSKEGGETEVFVPKREKMKETIYCETLKCSIVFNQIFNSKDLIDVAQNRDRWRAFVNAVMDLRVF